MSKSVFFALLFVATLLCQSVFGGSPGPIPDGSYNCHKISGSQLISLGDLEIKGATYRFSNDEPFAPFTIDSAGMITWSKGVSFLPNGWKVTSSEFKGMVNGKPMINIRYVSGSGFSEVIDCVKEK